MTFVVDLSSGDFSSELEYSPAQSDEQVKLIEVVKRIRSSNRIVVVCGAGISTAASIPDFRSSTGLFSRAEIGESSHSISDDVVFVHNNDIKGKGKARSRGHTVKDLFHVKCLSSSSLIAEHHALLNQLSKQCQSATPTSFHSFLSTLDSEGRLLRCYTQNIDALEARAGLEVGIPPLPERTPRKRLPKKPPPSPASDIMPMTPRTPPSDPTGSVMDLSTLLSPVTPLNRHKHITSNLLTPTPSPTPSITSNLLKPIPKCIPLHGQLTHMNCTSCRASFPIDDFLPLPSEPISCPECQNASALRYALSERQRRIGILRASVVLYGEEHPHGELIGSVVEKDLKGSRGNTGADLLIVAGTSLTIPGVKRLVKEMSRSLHARYKGRSKNKEGNGPRTILINNEKPKGSEWEHIFDIWIKGDIQKFITDYIDNPEYATESPQTSDHLVIEVPSPTSNISNSNRSPKIKKSPTKVTPTKTRVRTKSTSVSVSTPRRRKDSTIKSTINLTPPNNANSSTSTPKRRQSFPDDHTTPTKPRSKKRYLLPTPRPTPPNASTNGTINSSRSEEFDEESMDDVEDVPAGNKKREVSFWGEYKFELDGSLTPVSRSCDDLDDPFL